MGGAPPGPIEPHRPICETADVERLAIFLALGPRIRAVPENRVELLEAWKEKRESVRMGYRRRARRLLAAWWDE